MSPDDLDRLLAEASALDPLLAELAAAAGDAPPLGDPVAMLNAACQALLIGADLEAHALGLGGLMGARRRARRTRTTHQREERPE